MHDRFDIQDVLSRYVRATDERDVEALAGLFAEGGEFRFFGRSGTEKYQRVGKPLVGPEQIGEFVASWPPLPERMYFHHMTTDHVIEIDGDEATMNAQFLVIPAIATAEPEGGWPADLRGIQGSAMPTMIGFYDAHLRRIDGVWKLTRFDVLHSLPNLGN
ncbi:nuclear transport factor 2 family protein [Streptomyces sp. NPDC058864]